ncbi:ATP-binding protein [Mariniphaga sp.]|uniref:tetratricopeptide repeat-containing sensor histidine kinase n=1 Tax=Mariniphaga sp. TaxID=1954475 RepID=UPI003566D69F
MRLDWKTIFILLLIVLSPFFADAALQTKEDSLKQIFQSTEIDSEKGNALLQLARISNLVDKEKSIDYYTQALQYVKNESERGAILDTIGLYYLQLGNNTEALVHFQLSGEIFEQLNDSLWLGKIYNNIAVAHYWLGNSIDALNHYQNALGIRSALKDMIGVSRVLNNIGLIYQEWNLYKDALVWHEKALETAYNLNDTGLIAYSYSNIGQCYENLKNYNSALESYRTGFKYQVQLDEQNLTNSFFSLFFGELYSKMNMPDSALFHFQKAYDYAIRINNRNRLAIANYNLGKSYFEINELDLAKEHLNKSFNSSVENNYKSLEKDNLFILSKIAEKKGKISDALRYMKEANMLNDSLFNTEKIAKFTDLQVKYFTEQQNQENLLLKQQNEIQEIAIRQQKLKTRILIISGIFILAILFFIARSQISLKKLSARLEKSEKELLKANAGKDKFFTLIAHDLKSPFNGLLGVTEILSENFDELPPNQIKKLIFELKKSVTNVYSLVQGLLDWAQIQTGKIEYRLEKTDLFKLAEEVTNQLEASATNKSITLEQNIVDNTFAIADEKSVSTVFRNLISNAIKYTKPGGWVKVEAVKKENYIEVSVEDNGIGIPPETLKKLFTITEKISEQGTAKETGTGLGLILCKEFVEKNNGKIWAKSEQGKGSRFVFTLPAAN